ncbi:MAG TPA: isocitrate lyase/PEP mutase family protein [Candidatus Angelobacter sp.]|jgi:2-methylisocitrate lyase-like PEP mutase family enzyme|nr:isocitrate lyase/PEP mutase family protein [Candidatus Angelobacter sp.]
MEHHRRNWKRLLKKHKPMQLVAACDALTAKLIEQAGFPAYQVGGFALDGMRFGFPDMDVSRLGEKSGAVRDIIHACNLPVLVDCDDGYGDEKNVVHTIHIYDDLGASAIFMEDQKAPKRCGHMGGKEVIEPKAMVNKIRAACSARRDAEQLFIIARTDAIAVNGVDDALRRGEMYLKAGADGVYVEGPRNIKELEAVGRAFKGEPLAVTMLEGGGVTPWTPPEELSRLGFNMILYPTTLLFRQTRAAQRALGDLKAGLPMPEKESVTMDEFERIVDIAYWKSIEEKALPLGERVRQTINKVVKKIA